MIQEQPPVSSKDIPEKSSAQIREEKMQQTIADSDVQMERLERYLKKAQEDRDVLSIPGLQSEILRVQKRIDNAPKIKHSEESLERLEGYLATAQKDKDVLSIPGLENEIAKMKRIINGEPEPEEEVISDDSAQNESTEGQVNAGDNENNDVVNSEKSAQIWGKKDDLNSTMPTKNPDNEPEYDAAQKLAQAAVVAGYTADKATPSGLMATPDKNQKIVGVDTGVEHTVPEPPKKKIIGVDTGKMHTVAAPDDFQARYDREILARKKEYQNLSDAEVQKRNEEISRQLENRIAFFAGREQIRKNEFGDKKPSEMSAEELRKFNDRMYQFENNFTSISAVTDSTDHELVEKLSNLRKNIEGFNMADTVKKYWDNLTPNKKMVAAGLVGAMIASVQIGDNSVSVASADNDAQSTKTPRISKVDAGMTRDEMLTMQMVEAMDGNKSPEVKRAHEELAKAKKVVEGEIEKMANAGKVDSSVEADNKNTPKEQVVEVNKFERAESIMDAMKMQGLNTEGQLMFHPIHKNVLIKVGDTSVPPELYTQEEIELLQSNNQIKEISAKEFTPVEQEAVSVGGESDLESVVESEEYKAISASVKKLELGFNLQPNEKALVVDPKTQKIYIVQDGQIIKDYKISTAKKGLGSENDSYKTPPGVHKIATKIGDGTPLGTIFKARENTGKIATINEGSGDGVTTRIMHLTGVEPGINDNSMERNIYIHGTPYEARLGTPASWGCIRMSNEDVAELYELVDAGADGTLVIIQDGSEAQYVSKLSAPESVVTASAVSAYNTSPYTGFKPWKEKVKIGPKMTKEQIENKKGQLLAKLIGETTDNEIQFCADSNREGICKIGTKDVPLELQYLSVEELLTKIEMLKLKKEFG